MAYAQMHLDGRSPQDPVHEPPRNSWANTYSHRPPPYPASHVHSSASTLPPPDSMDPESSDSDVSTTGDEHYRGASPLAVPAQLPPPPPKHVLDSAEMVHARLRELNQVEDHNIRKQDTLLAKRRRKDERIARKRDIQDRKIKSIHDARERRDARTNARRAREDAAFKAVDDQMEDEETSLRRRLKRLKRGLPADESPQPGRSISTSSMSPPGPGFSTIPPSAKRHQSGPPGQADGNQALHQSGLPPPPANPPSAPSYSFYQSNQKPYTVPYHSGPVYSTVPPGGPPPPAPQSAHGPPPPGSQDRSHYGVNGRSDSPAPRPLPYPASVPNQNTTPNNAQSRQMSSTYDTRPPPTTSGFASINAPTTSGFAAINPRSAATPPGAHSSLAKPSDMDVNRTPAGGAYQDRSFSNSNNYRYNDGSPASITAASTPATGSKRTPSTTHPYQMSEAFANRHHHCERIDALQRGIWTSYGHGGTQEHPTGPPVEMYLRCNHENCRRIDWRTVHGLQCHIVKNHEQPKGTIGSLEKALDRYGVPVREVEDYEREHGEGTGGTMADPKNLKIKNKTKEAYVRIGSPASFGMDSTARPAGYKPSPPEKRDSPPVNSGARDSTGGALDRGYGKDAGVFSGVDESTSGHGKARKSGSGPPNSKFEAIRSDWNPSTKSPYQRVSDPPASEANRQLQGEAVTADPYRSSSWKSFAPGAASQAADGQGPPRTDQHDRDGAAVNPASTPMVPSQLDTPMTQTHAMEEQVKNIQKKQEVEFNTLPTPNTTEAQNVDTPMADVSEPQPVAEQRSVPAVDGEKPVHKEIQKSNTDKEVVPDATAMAIDGEKTQEKLMADGLVEAAPKGDSAVTPSIGGPASGLRSALQSPVMTSKPLNPPPSAKRISRRSSAARKLSGDSSVDGADGVADGVQTDEVRVDGVEKEKEKDIERDGDGSTKVGEEEHVDGVDGECIVVASAGKKEREKEKKDEGHREREREREDREREAAKTPTRRTANGRFTRKRILERAGG